MNIIIYLAAVLISWISKTVLYHYGFRWRHVQATILTKIIVAAAPTVLRGFLPFALPEIVFFPLGVGAALYLCKQFTNGKLYPDLVLIVVGVEIVGTILIDRWIVPMIL